MLCTLEPACFQSRAARSVVVVVVVSPLFYYFAIPSVSTPVCECALSLHVRLLLRQKYSWC